MISKIGIGFILLLLCASVFLAGMATTYRDPRDFSEAGPSSFVLDYEIKNAAKSQSYEGQPEGTLELKVRENEEARFYSGDGRELDLNVSPELVNNIKPGDTVRVTIELVDPGAK